MLRAPHTSHPDLLLTWQVRLTQLKDGQILGISLSHAILGG